MSTTSPLLRLTKQDLDENPDTWGTVLNVSALQLLEDAIAGTAAVTLLTTADYTLDATAGGPSAADSARYMIIDVDGSPGGATNIVVPSVSKVYLAANNTGDSSDIVIKTAAGTGPTIPAGDAYFVYCDGTNVLATDVGNAATATTATTATNATQLGGIAAANYARLNLAQNFTQGQNTTRVAVTTTTNQLSINCASSNAFYLLTTESFTVQAPSNATNGQQFSLIVEQGGGGPHTISFLANTFIAASGSAPVLSTTAGESDYLAFEYVTNLSGGARWIVSIIKDVSDI